MVLEERCRSPVTLQRDLKRAKIVLLAAAGCSTRRVEFLDFMDRVTGSFPNRQLHVVLDNLGTHTNNDEWLKAHPDVKFHFTSTSVLWLNQVEVWFSILQAQSLSGASFTSLKQLEQHIDAYIKAYNDRAAPFVWTKNKVRQPASRGAVSLLYDSGYEVDLIGLALRESRLLSLFHTFMICRITSVARRPYQAALR